MKILAQGFALFFFIHLFFSSAFAIQALKSKSTIKNLPNAIDYIAGYALTALLLFLSLVIVHNMLYGAVIASFIACSIIAFKRKQIKYTKPTLTLNTTVKISFCALVAIIYGPSLLGLLHWYQFPAIFDFPKHISAIISTAHATQWPAPNPWFPDFPFVYNVLFYLPLGFICQLLKTSSLFTAIFAVSVIWITWQTLSLLEMVMIRLGLAKRYTFIGLLFATFISGFTPIITNYEAPIGYQLKTLKLTNIFLDDPITSFVYIPQHIFSILCILSMWLLFTRHTKDYLSYTLQTLLLVSATFTSYILAPLVFLLFGVFIILGVLKKGNKISIALFQVILFSVFIIPIFWQLQTWVSSQDSIKIALLSVNWFYFSISGGLLVVFSLLAVPSIMKKKWGLIKLSYFSLFISSSILFLFVQHLDLNLKLSVFIRILFVPIAAIGFAIYWEKTKKFTFIRQLTLTLPILYCCLLSIPLAKFFVSHSFIRRDTNEIQTLITMKNLPFNEKILFLQPNQDIAAISSHLVYMDFSPYRKGAYLPRQQDSLASTLFKTPSSKLRLATKVTGIYDTTGFINLKTYKTQQHNPILSLMINNWYDQKNNLSKHIRIQSQQSTDSYLATPLNLVPGIYQITATVKGNITRGNAHLSLLGVQKLINIPAGNYTQTKTYQNIFIIPNNGFTGHLAFGLGGWSQGAGSIQLIDVTLQPIII